MNMTEWEKRRYKLFNAKIDSFAGSPHYDEWLRRYADDAIRWNSGHGFLQIKAADFIRRIEQMPLDYIRDWLDGKNNLEWK